MLSVKLVDAIVRAMREMYCYDDRLATISPSNPDVFGEKEIGETVAKIERYYNDGKDD